MNHRRFHIRTFQRDDLAAIQCLQDRYALWYPGASAPGVEVYCSPGFGSGANIFCAFSSDDTLVGFAPLLPALVTDSQPNDPHVIWAEIKVDPEVDEAGPMREALLGCVMDRSTDLVKRLPGNPTQVIIQSDPNETSIIEFLTSAGFVHTESVFHMQRDLGVPIAAVLAPPGMKSVPWRMEFSSGAEAVCRFSQPLLSRKPSEPGRLEVFPPVSALGSWLLPDSVRRR